MHSKKKIISGIITCVGMLLALLSMPSCISSKKVIYFSDIPDTINHSKPIVRESPVYKDPVIIPNDNLFIMLQTSGQTETNTPVNASIGGGVNNLLGYLVDKNGMIDYPLIGYVKVGGLTTHEAAQLLKEKAKDYYKEPVIRVRFMNFDISIMGEIRGAGVVSFPNEKVNFLEAIAAAGDLTITGRRHDILLIRTDGDERKFVRMDMTSAELFKSPYFYLRQRDIIYVKPTKFKIQSSDNQLTRNISIISSVISLALVFLSLRNIK